MSELEQRAIGKLIARAEKIGVGDQVPEVMRNFVAGEHGSNGGAISWARTHPDAADAFGCCVGNDVLGAEYCTCWVPQYDLEQATPILVAGRGDVATRTGMCHDCAYRPGSPERSDGDGYMQEVLYDLARGGEPFYCHQQMRRPVRWLHPDGRVADADPKDYQPPIDRQTGVAYKADGTPGDLCAGWAAIAANTSRQAGPDWLQQLVDWNADGRILPGGMVWQEPPPATHAGGRRGGMSLPVARDRSPMPPIWLRRTMYAVLRRHPGRWALIHAGGWDSTNAMTDWFRRHSAGFQMETVTRREGLSVGAYVRYLPGDVTS